MTAEPKRNLLLLTIDAWRADFVDAFHGVPLTPTLTSLAGQTLRFERAYTSGPWTSPGIVSMLTGQDALSHGVFYEWSVPRPGSPTLPASLSQQGYRVPNLCYLNRVGNYQNLGYDPATAPGYPTGPDDELLTQALRRLAGEADPSPWFAWYHYKYVHLPYWPAEPYRRLFSIDEDRLPARLRDSVCKLFVVPRAEHRLLPEDRDAVQRLYAANVRQMDDFLGRVLATLDQTGQREQTTIVLTADHGDELLEHGHVGHASTAHFATLYEELLRIPLLVIDPRIVGPRRSQARVQLQDLMPTLLSLAGGTCPQPLPDAVDLSPIVLDALAGSAATPERLPAGLGPQRPLRFHSSRMGYQTLRRFDGQAVLGFSQGNTKYICERFDEERRLLFDLATDPQEQHPVTQGPAVDAAHARLRELCPGVPA